MVRTRFAPSPNGFLHRALAVWRYDRLEGSVLAITAAAVLMLGIEIGLRSASPPRSS
jgi:hypothetical protein